MGWQSGEVRDVSGMHRIFDQPDCEHNHTKETADKDAGCARPEPGSAMGGCTFDGAQISLLPIADAVHLVHGPSACAANSWGNRGSLSGADGSSFTRRGFTTDLSEHDIIFGGEKKLGSAIREVATRFSPGAIFVYTTCVTALIGEDVAAVCSELSEELTLPVLAVQVPGFLGSKNLGNRLAGEVLLESVIGTREPEDLSLSDVNIIGEYNISGELWQIEDLLAQAGIRLRSSITGDGRYARIQTAHRARVSMVVCSRAMINVARGLLRRYGVPYFEGSFYGAKETAAALRNFAAVLGSAYEDRVERLIADQEEQLAKRLAPYVDILRGKKALLYTGGVKSWALISALRDLGVEVVATSSRKSTLADVAKMKELLGERGVVMEDGGPQQIMRLIDRLGADILLAGGRNQYTAAKGCVPFVDVNQERHRCYAAYDGLVNLAHDIANELSSPVYVQLRAARLTPGCNLAPLEQAVGGWRGAAW